MVEHVVPVAPAVVEVLQEGQAEVGQVGVEGQHLAGTVGLVEDAPTAGRVTGCGSPNPRTRRMVPR